MAAPAATATASATHHAPIRPLRRRTCPDERMEPPRSRGRPDPAVRLVYVAPSVEVQRVRSALVLRGHECLPAVEEIDGIRIAVDEVRVAQHGIHVERG